MTDTSRFFGELFDFNSAKKLKPAPGRVLISEPYMPDNHFSRSIVLLGEHNEEGTFGFVLNHYLELSMNEVMNNFPEFSGRIARGGPVKTNNLYYIHTLGKEIEGSLLIKKGLYMGGSFESVHNLIQQGKITPGNMRFFVGYAGWSQGQLEGELEQNAWVVSEASVKEIM